MEKITILLWFALLIAFPASIQAADQWEELNPSVKPVARWGHSMVELNGKAYIFGGQGAGRGALLNDLWKFDFEANDWTEVTPTNIPPARHSHSAATSGGKMYIFFGADENDTPSTCSARETAGTRWQSVGDRVAAPGRRNRRRNP